MAKIAIIDVDRKEQAILRSLLLDNKHSVEIALTAEDGLRLIDSFNPDIVLCDYGDAQGFGADVLLKCRKKDPAVAVVLMKTSPDPDIVDIFLDLGAAEFLHKPVSNAELISIVNRVVQYETPSAMALKTVEAIKNIPLLKLRPKKTLNTSLKRIAQEAQFADFINKVNKFREDNRLNQ